MNIQRHHIQNKNIIIFQNKFILQFRFPDSLNLPRKRNNENIKYFNVCT